MGETPSVAAGGWCAREDWQPTPFQSFLLKVHSRCNLDCSYCYIYHHADQSWRTKPKRMSVAVATAAAGRIREHALANGLEHVSITLHGGEPLLLGASGLDELLHAVEAGLGGVVTFDLAVQTNGALLTETIAEVCLRWRIRVGVSLDGDRTTNDLARVDHAGNSSYDAVVRALELLRQPRYRGLYSGILATIQLEADPLSVFEHLTSFGPAGVDFLLPHGTWASPPPGKRVPCTDTPYADWLIPIFDSWYDTRPKVCKIRLFDELIHALLGATTHFESIGLGAVNLVVVETDGTIEGVDTLKTSYADAPATGFDVWNHTFDAVLTHPSIVARQIGADALADDCRHCDLLGVCGGGYYPHRYHPESGFRTRSVYCADLMKLIRHIRDRLTRDLSALRGHPAEVRS